MRLRAGNAVADIDGMPVEDLWDLFASFEGFDAGCSGREGAGLNRESPVPGGSDLAYWRV